VSDRQQGPLGNREREILDILVTMHAELGISSQFTSDAIAHIAGPCTGSLAGLTLKGYVDQRVGEGGIVYQVNETGYALFAGIEGQL
jgi:hypothetical protein